MADARFKPTLTVNEKAVIKALLNQGWRGQNVQALINVGRADSGNSGRSSAIRADAGIAPGRRRAVSELIDFRRLIRRLGRRGRSLNTSF